MRYVIQITLEKSERDLLNNLLAIATSAICHEFGYESYDAEDKKRFQMLEPLHDEIERLTRKINMDLLQ